MNQKWQAQILVKWNKKWPKEWAKAKTWDWLKEWPEVKSAWSTMGDWDAVLWVEAKDPEELESFVCNKLWGKDWVEKTESTWARSVWGNAA
jgi:DNA-binding Lrp family transcriptional regulator